MVALLTLGLDDGLYQSSHALVVLSNVVGYLDPLDYLVSAQVEGQKLGLARFSVFVVRFRDSGI